MTRIRTLDFLPSIFQTPTNSQFLGATLDQIVNPPVTKKIEGYVGSKLGYGIDAKDYYVTEPNKIRKDYQLEPGVVFLKDNETTAKDFISYPGILDALKLQNGLTDNNNRLFNSQFYSWDSFTDLDKIINFNQYYWLPEGPPAVTVGSSTVFLTNDYIITDTPNAYNIRAVGAGEGQDNPILTLLRGGTYTFTVNQNTRFWIQGAPGVSGFSPIQQNLYTRDIYGIDPDNNGITNGVLVFQVPPADAQNELNLPGDNLVDLICDKKFGEVNGLKLSQLKNIDGVTALNGRTVLFFNGLNNEVADLGAYDMQQFDQTQTALSLSYDTNEYISITSNNFYTITYFTDPADPNDPFVIFIPTALVPTQQKITVNYGSQYVGLSFYKNIAGFIEEIPFLSAPLDTLYYQDGTNPNKVGIIKIIESNKTYTINVATDILGRKNYTSPNGVVFTNGLKIEFNGDIIPRSYLSGEYYVQGVGTAIELVPVDTLLVPEPFTDNTTIPYDSLPFDIGNFDGTMYVPVEPDYITIARNAINKNAWSRSNRWFHSEVISATAQYNENPSILDIYAIPENRAKRPIIEFYPNLKLFNSGVAGKTPIDFIDQRTTDAFSLVQGQQSYYPDVQTYTQYTGSIQGTTSATVGNLYENQTYQILSLGTTSPDTWISLGAEVVYDGDFLIGTEYAIVEIGTTTDWAAAGAELATAGDFQFGIDYIINSLGTTDWNDVANTTGITYAVGDIITAVNAGTGNGTAYKCKFFALNAGNEDADGYVIKTIFRSTGTGIFNSSGVVAGREYTIQTLGTSQWQNFGANVIASGLMVSGRGYFITDPGNTDFTLLGADNNNSGTYFVYNGVSFVGTGTVTEPSFTATSNGGVGTGTASQGNGSALSWTVTTITIDADQVDGPLFVGQYINDIILDEQSRLPVDTRILSISGTTTLTMVVNWTTPTIINGWTYNPLVEDSGASFCASSRNNDNLLLYAGARVIFANDENETIRNKIYVVNSAITGEKPYPIITLTEAVDGTVFDEEQINILRGFNNQGKSYWYDGVNYNLAQQKVTVNQPPLFDIFDENNISFSNKEIYNSSTFVGCKLFSYSAPDEGSVTVDDPVLGFPIKYSSINNVGDINFTVSLNDDTFDYVVGTSPINQKVNTGYVHNYESREVFNRMLGWQTAVAPSVQYQVFEFNYTANNPPLIITQDDEYFFNVTCDVPQLSTAETIWPSLQVYNNNTLLVEGTDYTVTNTTNSTTVSVKLTIDIDTVIQVLILSDKASQNAYYSIPINLNNNPFNTDIVSVDIGDIRGQYQSIFTNNPNTTGEVFGPNNFRDLGNIVPWGTRIIQNSASLVLPGAFLRTSNHNLFDALLFNSREYIKFKNLLVDTVSKIDFQQRFNPAFILDEALDQITSVKSQEMPFFWSDMIPNKAAFNTATYKFNNELDTSTYPLLKIYDFTTANYDGVLVYLTRTSNGITFTKQLYKDIDYTISTDSPSLVITLDLQTGDTITVKEYNQTYGSYIPNTPTKLGLYPVSIPAVVLDTAYKTPTYFIKGHDGSYNKLYGDYLPEANLLVDYRDQALLEFETRVYNNLKLNNIIPIQEAEIVPGFFRDTKYSYDEWLQMYSTNFLDWIGQNRLDYKTQLYLNNDEYSYNYRGSSNKIDNTVINIGYWRGIYTYFYDTSTPDQTPWAMIGYANKPLWWDDRYGPAPWTSDNLILWQDMENGLDWNNGEPIVIPQYVRPGLSKIIPVNDQGELLPPLFSVIANYNDNTFQRDWRIGDDAPVELSYRRSSTWPFDLMKLEALMNPANFFNLGADLDNYKYSEEFDQFLVNNRSHLVPANIEIYGNGTAKTSYINWIVDYEKQLGVDATTNIQNLLKNLDVRLVYRLAGFSDKTLLKFFVEKGSPDAKNPSLLIPDESYSILLYENQSYDKLIYSSVVIQILNEGYAVYGNSQLTAYFKVLKPVNNGNTRDIRVQDVLVKVANDYSANVELVPYGTIFYSIQEVAQFVMSYGEYLKSQGMIYNEIEQGIEINWQQMIAEFLYWTQIGWQAGSVVTLNPCANTLKINKENQIVQPLTDRQTNFILNHNLYPIQNVDLSIFRNGTEFKVDTLNQGDTMSYAQFNLSNIEHGIVFDNETLFNDIIYNLISGLRQNRIFVRGIKSAEWNGTLFASGFIYNQDNIQEWVKEAKYTKGAIVKYKNKYWTAMTIIQPNTVFNERDWKITEYDEIQKGLLPNPSSRSYESSLYYDVDRANLEQDADLLSFSLIGFRNRPYMESADLTDITQVNVYKNMIKEKGTRATLNAFKGAQLPQGGIDYEIYENWAIKAGEFGGTLNSNFIEFKLNESKLTGNPFIIGITDGNNVEGAQQLVPTYGLFNYGRPIDNANVLPTVSEYVPSPLFPDAGYVNFNDVKLSSYFYSGLPAGVNKNGLIVPINSVYVRDYIWLANYLNKWQVLTPVPIGQVLQVRSNLNNTCTVIFKEPHGLNQYDILSIINFDSAVNGYYVALNIINPYQIIINLVMPNNTREINGQGIGLSYQSQRVSQPSDIQNLPLLDSEFIKNTVWVDENDDGGWATYRKSINYKYDLELNREFSDTFGSAVAYSSSTDYLIGDAPAGKVYRYQYDAISEEYAADEILTGLSGFGTTIVHEQNITAISQPTNTPSVKIYYVNNTTVTDNIQDYQTLLASDIDPAITNFGSAVAMSGNTNWLFVSDYNSAGRNKVHVYRKANTPVTSLLNSRTYQITNVGTTDWTAYGANENKVGLYFKPDDNYVITGTGTASFVEYQYINEIDSGLSTADSFGKSLSTDYYGTTLVVGAPTTDFDPITENWGRSYVYQRSIQNIETQTISTTVPTTFELAWTPDITEPNPQVLITRNGIAVPTSDYSISGNDLIYTGSFIPGDILNISGNKFTLIQELTTEQNPRIGVQFGNSVDNNLQATEILVGAPFALNSLNQEGAVFRYTYGSARFGTIIGVNNCDVTVERNLLINGYLVKVQGDAEQVAQTINGSGITNIQAAASQGKLIISVIDQDLTQANQKLVIGVTDTATLTELGLELYSQTQTIQCPHLTGPTQFGTVVKFNEHNSVIISAPAGTRYAQTLFDFTDDENVDNDTVFDNNATQFIDSWKNVGAVYMYDYLGNYNESLDNIGAYTYAQSVNSQSLINGSQPRYGLALDFVENKVVVGAPYYRPEDIDGQVIVYVNETGKKNWSVLRQTNPIVDIQRVENMQIFSAESNNTLINLDYIDPLQGKIFGAVRENINVIANVDPAKYNNSADQQSGFVWGSAQVGTIWLDTTNLRFVNYHQNDNAYNAKYWGTLFPGSNVAVYSWISSTVPPAEYAGPGLPKDINFYSVQTIINSSNAVVPIYYFWVRNTGYVFPGKSLADVIIASYIANPLSSGIAYVAPLAPNTVALYNSQTYVNANDSVLHIGFTTGTNDDIGHQEFTLIRENYADDFLPGIPKLGVNEEPRSLYDRLLDSMAGVDESGQVVPDPFLPKAVQSGVLARPRQSFFYNRYKAIQNYIQFSNDVMKLFPISEIRTNVSFLYKKGIINPSTETNPEWTNGPELFYDTTQYWDFVNWWAAGYDDNTKSVLQVNIYADLSSLSVAIGTIVTVSENSAGRSETYRYDGDGVWTRIGLQNGTIKFKDNLFDYSQYDIGFDGDFFASTTWDQYPDQETRWIIRALNEQIYTNDLIKYRNQSLILLFEYIQAETVENQNYLPWLNKTSLVDVAHKIRELIPIQNFKSDNQEFLSGYVNEAKPYHVVVKEFLFEYTGQDDFEGNITDFDVPAKYNTTIDKFVSPELVYSNPNTEYEYLPTDGIWTQQEYNQWFGNYGVSITGQPNYPISKLASYMTLATNFVLVDNAMGFPVNGVIKLGSITNPDVYELIAYSNVDRALNILTGLVRGYNNTEVTEHLPGEMIYMDLDPVLVLNTGKNYENPPRVIATIDLEQYPAPRENAVLEAVMSLDKVVGIKVLNPGSGYAVMPEIRIDPSTVYLFSSANVDSIAHTIDITAPALVTGDIVRYVSDPVSGDNIGYLENDQWYYVNVLDVTATSIVALYKSLDNALNDHDRIPIYSVGTGNSHSLQIEARVSAVGSSYPVRENNITLRFDRTTYGSQVQEWQPNSFYASSFVDSLTDAASSNLNLEATQPEIDNVLASSTGTVFVLNGVSNERVYDWSSTERTIGNLHSNGQIELSFTSSIVDQYPAGSTVGFYVGMPIRFLGAVGPDLTVGATYFVSEISSLSLFRISTTDGGPSIPLTSYTPTTAFTCFTAKVIDTAILNASYPGIRTVTATTPFTNILTVQMTDIGTGGTSGLYTNCPIMFTNNVYGNVEDNFVYYVTSVLDNENFTMSDKPNPLTIKVSSTNLANQIILETELGLAVDSPIVFNNMIVNNIPVTSFGGIQAGKIYYIKSINPQNITISEVIGGAEVALTPQSPSTNTYCYLFDQSQTTKLTSGSGNMTMNISVPVSPGQVNGQLFTLYDTSSQFPIDTTVTNYGNLLSRTIAKTVGASDIIAITPDNGGTTDMYVGMPFRVDDAIGGLTTGTNYKITEIGIIKVNVDRTYISTTIGATVYNNVLRVNTLTPTSYLYVDMPITFTSGIGGINNGETYYVDEIINDDYFIVRDSEGSIPNLIDQTGLMPGTGLPYIKCDAVSIVDGTGPVTLNQYITVDPSFSISYKLGGYSAVITNPGEGFTIDNTITIPGTDLGGLTPENDLVMTVNTIDAIVAGTYPWSLPLESNGEIQNVICSGAPDSVSNSYYLKVTGENTFKVYSDPLMTVPVSGIDFPYEGITSTYVITTNGTTLTLNNASGFSVNDNIVFTGNTGNLTNITEGTYYYITSIVTNDITISEIPNGTSINVGTNSYAPITAPVAAKPGSFMLLPEPFYFNPSIVKYNNRLWKCIISNNDSEFIFGKWELLQSDNRILNAMDRTIGYYDPSINMPGVDLSQLFTGVTYPNTTYKGNNFQPDEQYEVDTQLKDQVFYPKNVNMPGVVFNGLYYVAPVNTPTYSGFVRDIEVNDDWLLGKLSNNPLNLTGIVYADNKYVVTSTNTPTPIFRSNDLKSWTTSGFYVPFGTLPEDVEFDKIKLNASKISLNGITHADDKWVAVGSSILTSIDAVLWIETYKFTGTGNIYGVTYVETPMFTGFLAAGIKDDKPVILRSNDGLVWNDNSIFNYPVSPPGNVLFSPVKATAASNNVLVAVGVFGAVYTSTDAVTWTFVEAAPETLNDVAYEDGYFIAAGNNGLIRISTDDGATWTTKISGTTENLNGINYVIGSDEWTIVGNNNTILQSTDLSSPDWDTTQIFSTPPTAYTVQGDPFLSGYGPEELVPGVVSDQLTMLVNTRPGTNWDVTEYGHTGYNVVSVEIPRQSDNNYSFADVVQTPFTILVALIDDNGLSVTLYEEDDYTIDWVNQVVTPVSGLTLTQKLRIDVYEAGNGDQLVKSNTESDPLRLNDTTGLQEIYLNCNYTNLRFNGGGIVQPDTGPIYATAYRTEASDNTIFFDDVSVFSLNSPITFIGSTFGGIVENTVYYVKTINNVRNNITVSNSLTPSGIAGSIYLVTDATGSMSAVVQKGPGDFWTEPAVYHNGVKLVAGKTNVVVRTIDDTLVTPNNQTLIPGQKIVFSETIFGGIEAFKTYYVLSLIGQTRFTISETVGGTQLTFDDAVGSAIYVTNDYAPALAPNQINAKIIFADQYDYDNDYIAYAFYGETEPLQYGYTLPQTQVIDVTSTTDTFDLTNYLGGVNPENAIVEVNGIRQTDAFYTLDGFNQILTFTAGIPAGSTVAVTTYNDTQRQYFNTQFGVTGTPGSNFETLVVESTNFVTYDYDSGLYEGAPGSFDTTLYDGNMYYLTLASGFNTSQFAVNDMIVFRDTAIGGVVPGRIYYVAIIYDNSSFAISETIGGPIVELTNDTGAMPAVLSFITVANIVSIDNTITLPLAMPAVLGTDNLTSQITLSSVGGIIPNQIVQVKSSIVSVTDGVASREYRIESLGNTDYTAMGWTPAEPGDTPQVGDVFMATGPGTGTGRILLANYGGLSTLGVTYFVDTVNPISQSITLKDQDGDIIPLIDESTLGIAILEVGGLESVEITTGIPHNFNENTIIQIDGCLGSTQLNNNTYYAHIIDDYTFMIYQQPYSPAINGVNEPVTAVSSYLGDGYTWRESLFVISLTDATATNSTNNTIKVPSTKGLVVNTPIYFTSYDELPGSTIMGGLIEGQKYYVHSLNFEVSADDFLVGYDYRILVLGDTDWNLVAGTSSVTYNEGDVITCVVADPGTTGIALSENEFKISDERNGEVVSVTTDSGYMTVTQWEQTNVDRLYVTVNGYRVPSSKLRLNAQNDLSILTTIEPGDEVIISSMIPTSTPNEMLYINLVDSDNQGSVYRSNTETRTWLSRAITDLDTKIFVHDIDKITNIKEQINTVEPAILGYHVIGLDVNKVDLLQVEVFNNTTNEQIDQVYLQIEVNPLGPFIKIQEGSWISIGDQVTITSLEGGLVFINGEYMRLDSVSAIPTELGDYECDVQRGANGSGVPLRTPKYSEVYSLLNDNIMTQINYDRTWNSDEYNTVQGDPLQISTTQAARFLRVDI